MPITDEVREKIKNLANDYAYEGQFSTEKRFNQDKFTVAGRFMIEGYSLALAELNDYKDVIESHRQLVKELDQLLNGAGAAQQSSLCDIVAQLRTANPLAELEALKAENERLNQWKKEAMPMMEDFQAIGKALGIPWGQSIHEKILPGIEAKDKEIKRLRWLVRVAHDTGFVTGFNADKSKARIQNAWDEFKQQHNL